MSAPQPVLPHETVMITRRCVQRQFLLRPSRRVNAIVGVRPAVASQRYGVIVHGFCFMSNHVHIVLTDVHGNRPEFC